jgi:hypothetical protein
MAANSVRQATRPCWPQKKRKKKKDFRGVATGGFTPGTFLSPRWGGRQQQQQQKKQHPPAVLVSS